MNKEIADKVVKELRNGNNKQGKGSLRNFEDEFCCLGVMCMIAVEEGIIKKPRKNTKTGEYEFGEDKKTGTLPQAVVEWAGVKSAYVAIPDGGTLMSLNDSGKTFEEIADVIEKYYEKL